MSSQDCVGVYTPHMIDISLTFLWAPCHPSAPQFPAAPVLPAPACFSVTVFVPSSPHTCHFLSTHHMFSLSPYPPSHHFLIFHYLRLTAHSPFWSPHYLSHYFNSLASLCFFLDHLLKFLTILTSSLLASKKSSLSWTKRTKKKKIIIKWGFFFSI